MGLFKSGWRNLGAFFEHGSPAQALGVIVVVSMVVKLAFIAVFGGGFTDFPPNGSDGEFYHKMAVTLWQQGYYGTSSTALTTAMPPGQSVFLASIYALSGGSLWAAKLGHVVILTLAAVLTYLTGRLVFNHVAAFAGGLLIALDPAQAYLAATFLSDGLFIFLILLGIYCFIRPGLTSSRAVWWWIGSGVCFALGAYVRNQGWLFALSLWGVALLTWGRWINLRAASVALATTVLVIAPWTIRNYHITGHFIPISSEGGLTLWASNNPEFEYRPPMPMSLPLYTAPRGLSEYDLDWYYRRRALDWIGANPARFVEIGLRKFWVLYHFDPTSWHAEVAGLYRLAGLVPYGVMLPFIVLGLGQYWRKPQLAVIVVYIIFSTGLAMLFYGDSRIRAPIQPYLYLLGTAWLISWVRRKNLVVTSAAPNS